MTDFEFTVKLSELIPVATGVMVFTSILLARSRSSQKAKTIAWTLGLGCQVLLITLGYLTGITTFYAHLLPALAFAYNLWDDVKWRRAANLLSKPSASQVTDSSVSK